MLNNLVETFEFSLVFHCKIIYASYLHLQATCINIHISLQEGNMLFYTFLFGCSDVHDHDHNHEEELITTILLRTTDEMGNENSFRWSDMGGTEDIFVDDIMLSSDTKYQLNISFLNELEEEPEDLTKEIQDEGTEHQVFFTGIAIQDGLLEHFYLDTDSNGLPLGIENQMNTADEGVGDLTISLRHMPEEGGQTIKIEGLAEIVLEEGFGAIGGSNDLFVTFPVFVE